MAIKSRYAHTSHPYDYSRHIIGPQRITDGSGTQSAPPPYTRQADVIRDMGDPRYKTSEDFRHDVALRLSISGQRLRDLP